MQTAIITGERQGGIENQPDPRIRAPFVKIKIHAAPMCTEVQAYRDGGVTDRLGHEAAGEVVEADGPSKVAVGDRVVVMPQFACGKCRLCLDGDYIHCDHPLDPLACCHSETGIATYAQYCIKQDWLLLPIPADLSYDHASMACCGLGPTFSAVRRMQVSAADTVLVSGLGAVGLGGVINAVALGARVLAIESHPYRAELGKTLGAEAVIDPKDPHKLQQILDLTGGRGADKSIETSSAENAPAFLLEATRARGHVASVGWGGPMLARRVVAKGLTVHGVWHWNHLRDAEAMIATLRKSRAALDRFITHTFPLARVQDAWELQLTGQCGKIVLHPWDH